MHEQTQAAPAIRSRGDIEELKRGWLRDPIWDIEDTEGYEAHQDELRAYRLEMEAQWRAHAVNQSAMARQRAMGMGEVGSSQGWLRQAKSAVITGDQTDAGIFAAIAQAEALTRIAEVLETMLEDGLVICPRDALADSIGGRIWGASHE